MEIANSFLDWAGGNYNEATLLQDCETFLVEAREGISQYDEETKQYLDLTDQAKKITATELSYFVRWGFTR